MTVTEGAPRICYPPWISPPVRAACAAPTSSRWSELGRQRFCSGDRGCRVDQPERPPWVSIVRGDQLLGGVEQVVDPRQRRAGAAWIRVPADAAGQLDPRQCAGGYRRWRRERR